MTRYGRHVAGPDQKTGFAIKTNLVRAVKVVRDDRPGCGECLWQRSGKGFALREVSQAIHNANVARHFSWWDKTGKDDFVSHTQLQCLRFKLPAQGAITNEKQSTFRLL